MTTPDERKRRAAERATEFIASGMVVGLGHGSTAAFAVKRLAKLLSIGTLSDIVAIPCSDEVREMATTLGIPLATLAEHPAIDLTIDGADEVDPKMNLIKGGGGALLREKVVARASRREIIVVDQSKLSPKLGTRFALPVEVLPSAADAEAEFLRSTGADVSRRGGDAPFVTDSGNHILDCRFDGIDDPPDLARSLEERPGIADHGLFIGLTTDLIVAGPGGTHHFVRGQDWTAVISP
jgi:ribose 5-phosphate isomerase A